MLTETDHAERPRKVYIPMGGPCCCKHCRRKADVNLPENVRSNNPEFNAWWDENEPTGVRWQDTAWVFREALARWKKGTP